MLKEKFMKTRNPKLFHTGLTAKGNPTHPGVWKQVPVFRMLTGYDIVKDKDIKYNQYIPRIQPCGPIGAELNIGVQQNEEPDCAGEDDNDDDDYDKDEI